MIGAIVVLYNPDFSITRKALESLKNQVDKICVVDNSFENHLIELKEFCDVEYISLKKNVGIAAAQNIGIAYFIQEKFDFIIFSDQDSIAPEGVVDKLYNAYFALQTHGYKVGITGTRAINRQTGKPYPPKSKEFAFIPGHIIGYDSDLTEVYSVISSISLISTISLVELGGFDESLFIDGVDHEWCWRAWHHAQLRSFIVEDALISHQLGEGDKKFASKEIAIASPFRVYYQFRNYLWLCRRDYVPSFWKKKHLLKYMVKFFYFSLCVSPRMKYAKNILKGIYDGLFKYKKYIEWPTFQQENA